MPKILLSTLNAKYIHLSLALRYLRAVCPFPDVVLCEYTINEPIAQITADIFRKKPDILCFSCYIWNIESILQISDDIKQVLPKIKIILGGPEVFFDGKELMYTHKSIDYIVKGEGEVIFPKLLISINNRESLKNNAGIVYREGERVVENPDCPLIEDLGLIPSPYAPYINDDADFQNHLVYYETSRGCPFNCTYCLSSTNQGVRFFPLPRVKQDLAYLIARGVKKIKFVDRTFNCNEHRAIEIMQFILSQKGNTQFHFEICADLMSDSMLEFLSKVPKGIFDFEIGIQSTLPAALESVKRKSNWSRLSHNIQQLKKSNNIRLHLDLIAGLPQEDYYHFSHSFDMVYNLKADVLQLGFLKLLKGSAIRREADRYGYVFQSRPPYQVLGNNYINYGELIDLIDIEKLVDKYYNSGRFFSTLEYICSRIYSNRAFKFYQDFACCWHNEGWFQTGHKNEELYSMLIKFIRRYHPRHQLEVNELLKFDYLKNHKSYDLPQDIERCNPTDINKLTSNILNSQCFADENKDLNSLQILTRKNMVLEFYRIAPENQKLLDKPQPILFIYKPRENHAFKIFTDINRYFTN